MYEANEKKKKNKNRAHNGSPVKDLCEMKFRASRKATLSIQN